MELVGLAFGAALAVGLCGLGTGYAQARIGSAGLGAMAERPEMFASSVIMMAIPETVIILGFVVAVMIMLVLPGA